MSLTPQGVISVGRMSGQTNLQKRTILPSSCTSPGLPTEKTLTYHWVSAGGGAPGGLWFPMLAPACTDM